MDEFNIDSASEFLESLKAVKPERKPRESMKKMIMNLAPVIHELVELGYSRRQIYDLLKDRFNLKIGYGAFRNYLNLAEREEAGLSRNTETVRSMG